MKQLLAANIPDLRERNIDIYLTVVIAFVIGLATLTPVEKLTVVSGSDKLYHLLSFAILTFTIAMVRPKAVWWILILSLIFGGAIEVLQPLVNRSFEVADFSVDECGALLGILDSGLLGAFYNP